MTTKSKKTSKTKSQSVKPKVKAVVETLEDFESDQDEDQVMEALMPSSNTQKKKIKGSLLDDSAINTFTEAYKRPNQLEVPEETIQDYLEKGYALGWVRIYIDNGQLDVKNIRLKEADGYQFITKDELPNFSMSMTSFFSTQIDKHDGLIMAGDLALAKIPLSRVVAKRRFYADLTNKRSESIIGDIKKHKIGDAKRGDVYKTEHRIDEDSRNVQFGD